MNQDEIIQALSKLLQKRNNDIINLEIQIETLTLKLNADTKKEEIEKDDKVEKQDI